MRDVGMRPDQGGASSLTIDAMPYTRTVTCTGTYTLTGTATGGGAVTWAASPSGDSGACTGTGSWSCDAAVSPNVAGEGLETITISQSGGGSDTVDVGYYVAGSHSCFLAQSINGAYNVGMADLDAVATWENVGSSALDVTQAVGAAQPTFRTSIVGGQPVVRCDGGDRLAAATAADWTYLYDGTNFTVDAIHTRAAAGVQTYLSTTTATGAHGFTYTADAVSNVYFQIFNAAPAQNININRGGNTALVFHLGQLILDDDGGAGADGNIYVDGTGPTTGARASTYSVTTASALNICAFSGGGSPTTGDLFRIIIYQSALDATQRGINLAVDEWALSSTLPVTP